MFRTSNVRARFAGILGAGVALALSVTASADGILGIGQGSEVVRGNLSGDGTATWDPCLDQCACHPWLPPCIPLLPPQLVPQGCWPDGARGVLYGYSAAGHFLQLDAQNLGNVTDLGETGMDLSGVTGSGLRPSSVDASGGVVPPRVLFSLSDGTFWRVDLVAPLQVQAVPPPEYAPGDANFGHVADIEGLAFDPAGVQGLPHPFPWVAIDTNSGSLVGIDFSGGLMYSIVPGGINWPGPCHWLSMAVGGTGKAILAISPRDVVGCDTSSAVYTFDLGAINIRTIPQPVPPEGIRLRSLALIADQGGGTCNPDFNGDGDIGTDADIEAFFACLAGNCCPTCGSPDFNGDGDIGTDADIEAFFRVLAGGPC